MPYPDSEYPSILRGRDKRESQRLLAAAPEMLDVLRQIVHKTYTGHGDFRVIDICEDAIAKAEGRE